jgi:hypothetical protein
MVPNFTLLTNCKAKLWYKYIYLNKKTQIAQNLIQEKDFT